MSNELNIKNNLTTIVAWIIMSIVGGVLGYAISPTLAGELAGMIIFFIFALYNSKHSNTFEFLGNSEVINSFKGNFTSVISWLIISIGGALFGYTIDPSVAGVYAGSIAGVIFSLYNSKNLNNFSFLSNTNTVVDSDTVE